MHELPDATLRCGSCAKTGSHPTMCFTRSSGGAKTTVAGGTDNDRPKTRVLAHNACAAHSPLPLPPPQRAADTSGTVMQPT